MPESITTDDKEVASILAAAELTKDCSIAKQPEVAAEAFQTIYRAIIEARKSEGPLA